jgi:hypothetical protein
MRCIGLCFLSLIVMSGTVFADTATLRNGREIHGRLIVETSKFIELRIAQGGRMRIMKEDIATFTENDNHGQNYGKGGVKSPRSRNGSSGKKSGGVKGSRKKVDSKKPRVKDAKELFRDSLPKASRSLKAEEKEKLLEKLFSLRDPKGAYLSLTVANAEENEELTQLFKDIGYARKAGNRGLRGQALEKLKKFGVKALPKAIEGLKNKSNVYVRRNSLRCITHMVEKGERWGFYNSHFGISEGALGLLVDQAHDLSFGVRSAANDLLKKTAGEGVGFIGNTDQFRTANQLESKKNWTKVIQSAEKSYKRDQEKRREKFEEALSEWKEGS